MKFTTLYDKRKRAISPVIAVILLIGLAVAASAAIFLVVLPLFEPTTSLELNDAYVIYDGTWTKAVEDGNGYGIGTLVLSNAGTGAVEIVSFKIYYSLSIGSGWTEVSNAVSLDDISNTNPYVIDPLKTFDPIDIRFPLPQENDDFAIYYQMIIETSSGSEIDTNNEAEVVDADEMRLAADRPTIGSLTLDTIRRTHTVSPSGIDDNSEVKNVVFDVLPSGGGASVKSETLDEPLWRWSWNTRTPDGLPNDDYLMNITVTDYAGLSSSISSLVSFTIDNDYTPPTINYVEGEAPEAEVGTTYEVTANVIDTGSGDSDVVNVYLLYRLENATVNTTVGMVEGFGNNWTASIPIDARALENNIEYFVDARDKDANQLVDHTPTLTAVDSQNPDITHTPITSANEQDAVIFTAEVEDPGLVDTSNVHLYVRKANDLDANATVSGIMLPSSWVQLIPSNTVKMDSITWEFTWTLPEPYYNVTIHGLDYYISATDVYGPNTALHGTSTVPHHIQVLDLNPPDFIGISTANFPSSWTENTSYPITVQINDNDPTFGRDVGGDLSSFNTGEVTIHFKAWDGDPGQSFSPANINSSVHISGNSSNGEITIWFGTIPNDVFVFDENQRVDFYLTLEDQSKSDQDQASVVPPRWPESGFYSIEVKDTGQPDVKYTIGSSSLSNNNATVSLMINNTAAGEDSGHEIADATLTGMYLEVYSEDWDFTNGAPNLTQVYFTLYNGDDFSYNSTVGDPYPWVNGSLINFDAGSQGFVEDDNDYNIIELTFSNTSGGSVNMHNMILNITFKAKVGPTDVADQVLGLIATPGVEPPSDIHDSYPRTNNLGHPAYYVSHWLASPYYSSPSGIGWASEGWAPWTLDYSLAQVTSGQYYIYDNLLVPSGGGTHTDGTHWNTLQNNQGYRIDIEAITGPGDTSNSYIWFYAVVLWSGSDTPATITVGSDDEAVAFLNGQRVYDYTGGRPYREEERSVTLLGNNENNFVLFGVHEIGGNWHGGLAFSVDVDVKIYTGPPPAPLSSPLMGSGSSSIPGAASFNAPIQIYRETVFIESKKSF